MKGIKVLFKAVFETIIEDEQSAFFLFHLATGVDSNNNNIDGHNCKLEFVLMVAEVYSSFTH